MVGFLSLLIPAIAMLLAIGWGFAVGVRRVRIRFIIVAVCFVLSLIAALLCTNVSYADLAPVMESLRTSEMGGELIALLEGSETLQQALISSAGALIAPMVFLVTFVGLCVVTWILMWIVFLILKLVGIGRGKKSPVQIAVFSAVQVMLTVFVFATAIVSYIDVVPDVMDIVKTVNEKPDDPANSADLNEIYRLVDDNVEKINKAPLTVMYRFLGGNATCKALTTVRVDEEKSTLAGEINGISKLISGLMKLTKTDIKNYSEKESAAIDEIVDAMDGTVLLPAITGEVIYGATDAWIDEGGDGEFLGVKKPEFKDATTKMFAEAFDHILEAFHKDARNKDALCKDFQTLSGIVTILTRDGVFTSMNDSSTDGLVNALSSGTTIQDLVVELGKNDSFKILIADITNIGMRAIGSSLKIPENAEEIYAQFTDDIAASINEVKASEKTLEEQKTMVAESIRTAFAESGNELDLDDEILNLYAETLLEDFEDYETVTATDVEEFFRVFAEVNEAENPIEQSASENSVTTVLGAVSKKNDGKKEYKNPAYAGKTTEELKKGSAAGMLANVLNQIAAESEKEQTDEDFLTAVGTILKTNYENYAAKTGKDAAKADSFASKELSKGSVSKDGIDKTASMKSAEDLKAVTVLITMEDLLADAAEASKNLSSAEAVQNEAAAIQGIFGSAANILDKISESWSGKGMEFLNSVAESLGSVLDSMSATSSVGEEKTNSLLVAVFQSETVRESANLDIKTATELANTATEKDENGNKNSFKDTMNGLSSGANIASKMADENEELTEDDIRELLENMTPQTAKMLKIYMNEERVKSFGVPESKKEISTELIQNLLTEMGEKHKYPDYESETKGILNIFNLATAASKNESGADQMFNRDGVKGKLNATAEETVNSIFISDMVCNAVVNTLYQDGELHVNPFGLNVNEGDDDFVDCKNAIEDYYTSYEGEKNDAFKLRVRAIAALLAVDQIDFID